MFVQGFSIGRTKSRLCLALPVCVSVIIGYCTIVYQIFLSSCNCTLRGIIFLFKNTIGFGHYGKSQVLPKCGKDPINRTLSYKKKKTALFDHFILLPRSVYIVTKYAEQSTFYTIFYFLLQLKNVFFQQHRSGLEYEVRYA